MSTPGKSKSPSQPAEAKVPGVDEVFSALEERVEALARRVRALSDENARLRGAVEEAAAERDRLKAELATALEIEARQSEASDRLSKMESEREAIRGRIERLVRSLEAAEGGPEAA